MKIFAVCGIAAVAWLGCRGTTSSAGLEAAGGVGAGRNERGAGAGAGHAGAAGLSAMSAGGGGAGAHGGPAAGSGAAGGGRTAGGAGRGLSAGAGAGNGNDAGGVTSDAGADSSSCARASYVLCEDFETTELGQVPSGWTQHGDAAVGSDQVNRGKHALKVGAAANGQRRIQHSLAAIGATSGTHWGRVYYRVKPQPTPSGDVIHATFVGLHGTSPLHDDAIEVRVVDTVANVTGKHQFLFNVEPDSARGEFGDGSSYNWTFDGHWHCAEWRVASATQSYRFFIDSQEVSEIAQNNGAGNFAGTELPDRFDSVAVGINNYQNAAIGGSPGYEMWLDDFAIDDDRIGCD